MPADGYVVLADTFYGGWQATVDGQPVPILRANGVVRAVAVPAGAHEIRFVFRPADFAAGAALSTVAALAGVLALVAWRRERGPQ